MNKAIVRGYFEAVFNDKQLDLVSELFAPNAIYTLAGLPEPVQGLAAIEATTAGFLAGVPDLQMTIESLIGVVCALLSYVLASCRVGFAALSRKDLRLLPAPKGA